jgi:Raf kinase inhibitor-like YbhB/YbcL family protein
MTRAVAIVLALVAVACASDGNTLRSPPPGASAPPLTSSTVKNSTTVRQPITLVSASFASDGPLPIENTCDGENSSPPLSWGGVPEGTVELALTMVDTDVPGHFVHWVMTAIDPGVQALNIGDVPDGAVEVKNDAGTIGYTGPCPPKGAPHHYVFTLYALSSPSGVLDSMTGKEAILTLDASVAVTASLTGTYQRAG